METTSFFDEIKKVAKDATLVNNFSYAVNKDRRFYEIFLHSEPTAEVLDICIRNGFAITKNVFHPLKGGAQTIWEVLPVNHGDIEYVPAEGGDGVHIEWHEDGTMKYRLNYKDGKEDGLQEGWYENGHMKYRENWKDGKRDGLQEGWYENGHMKYRENWKDGKLDGLQERWYEDGTMEYRVNWKDGKLDGLREWWYEDGTMKSRGNWKDGEKVEDLPLTDESAPMQDESMQAPMQVLRWTMFDAKKDK